MGIINSHIDCFLSITNRNRNALLLLWIVRIGVSDGFMLLFESYYPGDAWFFR